MGHTYTKKLLVPLAVQWENNKKKKNKKKKLENVFYWEDQQRNSVGFSFT